MNELKPFETEDLFLYQEIMDLDCAAGGNYAACQLQSIDRGADAPSAAIWLVPLEDGAPRQFTAGPLDGMPRWSPDGSQLAFLSDRGSGRQIHLIARDGGEARALSNLPSGAMEIMWSPNGERLLALATLPVDPDIRGDHSKPQDAKRPPDAPKVIWRLPYKMDGVGYLLDTEIHLFAVDAQSGKHVQLTEGSYEVRSASFSPDCSQIAYTRTRVGRQAHRTDLWLMNADGSGQRQVSREIASVQYPRWSPDGKHIVLTGSYDEGDSQLRLWRYDLADGSVHALGDDSIEVVSGQSVHWSADSSKVFFVLGQNGLQVVASASVPDGGLTTLVDGERHVSRLVTCGDRLVYLAESLRAPNDVYCSGLDGRKERRLTDFNGWWRERILPQVQYRNFEVPDGEGGMERVDGWLLRPPGATGPTPLLVDAHGGPATYALIAYNWHVYWPVLVGRGWSVLALNPVGSSSYGRQFSARLRGNWGRRDLDQHLAAVDILEREGVADGRTAITGKSYGGYLAAWAIANSRKFRVAVVSSPVSNLESHFAISDSGYYADPYAFNGEPRVERERTRELSPMQHIEKARTPTLFLQGEADERCPKCQSEELFVALMRYTETPAEMVIYPGGSHHFYESGKPSHRLDMLNRLVGWIERWIDTELPSDDEADQGSIGQNQAPGP